MANNVQSASNKPMTREQKTAKKLQALTESTVNKIMELESEKKLSLPQNFSAQNAVNAARLIIMDDDKLNSCSTTSIANAMLNMCILGLNPAKKQCYFINYGDRLGLMTSYHGNKMLAMRMNPNIKEIIADVVKEGEVFEFEHLTNGNFKVTKHEKTLESMDSENYVAGYATVFYKDDTEPKTLVMTWKRILKSWEKSTAKPFDENGNLKKNSVHANYTDDMIKRTLINAITKEERMSSTDSDLFTDVANSVALDNKILEAEETIREKTACDEFVDVDFDDVDEESEEVIDIDVETGEVMEEQEN